MKKVFLLLLLVSRVHFFSNSAELPPEERSALDQNVEWLKENPKTVVILEGHCDEWGDHTYNMELGDRRARETKAYLIEKGVNPERIIMVVSFGETRPLDDRHISEAWRQNRRVEFVLR
ncbi:MAG: OmpA family protein [Deltaproteobacteria bacterium]|nr:OmpA family protein [Deltaproteobacteria bacterium]